MSAPSGAAAPPSNLNSVDAVQGADERIAPATSCDELCQVAVGFVCAGLISAVDLVAHPGDVGPSVLGSSELPTASADAMQDLVLRTVASAIPTFADRLGARRSESLRLGNEALESFVRAVAHEDDPPWVQRVARRLGLAVAGSEVAVALGALPWPPGSATVAGEALYRQLTHLHQRMPFA